MNAMQFAWDAVRALKTLQAARREVERLQYLVEEAAQDLAACAKDGEQPRYIQVMDPSCTLGSTFRCGCRRCNEWTTYSRWYRSSSQGYYQVLSRHYDLERQLDEALQAERQAARDEKRLAKEARTAALELDA